MPTYFTARTVRRTSPGHDIKLQSVMGLQFGNYAVYGKLEDPLAIIIPMSILARSGDVWQGSSYGSNSLFKGGVNSLAMQSNHSKYGESIRRWWNFHHSRNLCSWAWPQCIGHTLRAFRDPKWWSGDSVALTLIAQACLGISESDHPHL